ncbi:MAG: replication-associated recombination protein A, partial [Gemmatimonadota bacterium]
NAPTGLMRDLGYGAGYRYAHDEADAVIDQEHLPHSLAGRVYYEPTDRGFEARLGERMAELAGRLREVREAAGRKAAE